MLRWRLRKPKPASLHDSLGVSPRYRGFVRSKLCKPSITWRRFVQTLANVANPVRKPSITWRFVAVLLQEECVGALRAGKRECEPGWGRGRQRGLARAEREGLQLGAYRVAGQMRGRFAGRQVGTRARLGVGFNPGASLKRVQLRRQAFRAAGVGR